MKSKVVAIFASATLSVAALFAFNFMDCAVRVCVEDNASVRAMALFGAPLLIAYVLFSWVLVFPSMLALRKRTGAVGAALIVSVSWALALAWLLGRSSFDDTTFTYTFGYWLLALIPPWVVGGLLALSLWPTKGRTSRTPDA